MPSTNLHSPVLAQLDKLDALSALLLRAKSYASLESLMESELPVELRAHARFVSIERQQIRFLADSSAWATKLRLLSTKLIAHAHALGHQHVTTLTVRVRRAG